MSGPIEAALEVAVIGGGAAGFFAAVNLAEKAPGTRVVIFEAGLRPLQKVFISGGGRCNVTHSCFEIPRLVEHYPRGSKELLSPFNRFQPADTVAWFEKRGLKLKTEPDGRMFPTTDRSQDVIDLLLREAARLNIVVKTACRIQKITLEEDRFVVGSAGGDTKTFDQVVLATGYSPPGWELARGLGHKIIPPVPSLFPMTVSSPVIAGLQGISVQRMKGSLKASGKVFKAEGPMLITHTGLSGPLIYRLSAQGARELAEAGYQGQLTLDFLPDWSFEDLQDHLRQQLQGPWAAKKLANTKMEGLSERLWHSLLTASGGNLESRGDATPQKVLNRLTENLKRLTLPVSGKSPSKEEFVSCGGVDLKEVDFRTMESKLCPGLYFGGEILNIDGLTGGFNFQACWSAGWVISEAFKELFSQRPKSEARH